MSITSGMDGSWRIRRDPITTTAGAHELEHRVSRQDHLATGTLACNRCDAPVALGSVAVTPADPISCPYCSHRATVRDFLSLALPTRPTRVSVRVVQRP